MTTYTKTPVLSHETIERSDHRLSWSFFHRSKGSNRKRKTEKEEDEELLAAEKCDDKDDATDGDEPFVFTESPSCEFFV